jgi:hypothetical protein
MYVFDNQKVNSSLIIHNSSLSKISYQLMAKQKLSKQQQDAKDRAENRRFMMIFVAATIVLVALMYYLMR